MEPSSPLTSLSGVGSVLAAKFKKLRIETIQDLIEHVPFRYEDFSQIIPVSRIRPGKVTIQVTFTQVKARYIRRGLHITEAMARDETGAVKIVWFNQPYRASSIKSDTYYYVSGEFGKNYRFFAITNPAIERVDDFPVNTARLVPVYKLTKGLQLTQVRRTVKTALDSCNIPETLPSWLVDKEQLVSKIKAYQEMHFPTTQNALEKAKERLGYEEVFELMLASELNRQAHAKQQSVVIPFHEKVIKKAVDNLQFTLTDDQRKVTWQLFQDMNAGVPMNRLIQGDVGSGKTVVAVLAAINAIEAGYQVAFMAPTELLAAQHAESIRTIMTSTHYNETTVLVTGRMNKSKRTAALNAIKSGQAQLIIGTHALFQDALEFHNLGLVIVDEQHRFGVEQRKALQAKAKVMPHVMHLSATPIPRSLALTLYGDMSLSVISQMPAGRKPVQTKIAIAENREKIYRAVAAELQKNHQAFVVCPQIEEADEGSVSVKKVYEKLQSTLLKEFRVGLLHGKMSSQEKEAVMQSFVKHDLDVLVATTVIEVGVNVPNASVMVIEGADLFGLAQLHQLRGRVGRGSNESYCYLVLSSNDPPSRRLRYIETEHSGFTLADYDLELRGPGAIYGTLQHGALDLRVARLSDTALIERARRGAKAFVQHGEELLHYPHLNQRIARLRTITNLN